MAGAVGLSIDMAGWKKSCDEAAVVAKKELAGIDPKGGFSLGSAMKDSLKDVDAKTGGWGAKITGVFGKITGSVGGFGLALGGIGTAIAGAVAAGGAFYSFMSGCAAEAKEVAKGWKAIHGNMKLLSEDQKKLFKDDDIKKWADSMTIAFGLSTEEILKTSATAIGRLAKTPQQMQDLGLIAAAVMKRTGKTFAESMKMVTEIGAGQVDQLKELGISIAATGDPARDGAAALKMLATAMGGDLPAISAADRLTVGLKNLRAEIGAGVLPTMKGLQTALGDFVIGLTESAKGQEILKDLAYWFDLLVNFSMDFGSSILDLGQRFGGFFKMVGSGIMTFATGIIIGFADPILATIQKILEGLEAVSSAMGGSADYGSKSFKAMRDELQKTGESWADATKDGWNTLSKPSEGTAVTSIRDITSEGKKIREKEAADAKNRLEKIGKEGIGETRLDDDRAKIKGEKEDAKEEAAAKKASQKLQAQQQKQMQKQQQKRTGAMANLRGGVQGQQVKINIMSTSPQRYQYS